MASIIQNKKNGKVVSYRLRVYLGKDDSGKQQFRFTTWKVPEGFTPAKAKKAALKAAEEWEQEVRAAHEEEQNQKQENKDINTEFASFVRDVWIPIVVCDGQRKTTTVEFYKQIAEKIIPNFQGRMLQDITTLEVQKYFVYLRTKYKTKYGKPLSDKTVRHHYVALKQIFRFAEEQELIEKNPMAKISPPKKTRKPVDAFTEEQAKDFLEKLKQEPLDFQCLLLLLITTGVRRGEVLGLQWRDIDFEKNLISVERNVTYTPASGIIVSTPKTVNSVRVIPAIPSVVELLQKYKEQSGSRKKTDFLFPSTKGVDIPKIPDSVTDRVIRFMKRSGLPALSPHDLRHSCATLLLNNGATVKAVQGILGHASAATTLDYYVRMDLGQMQSATDQLALAFGL